MFRKLFLIILLAIALLNGQTALAGDDGKYLKQITAAVDEAINAWKIDDDESLRRSLRNLLRFETYLLVSGTSNGGMSYLARLPENTTDNVSAVAAGLFLIRQREKGIELAPNSFFAGRRFTFIEENR